MASDAKSKTTTTITVDDDFKERLVIEGNKLGLGWTTMLQVLARKQLADQDAASHRP